MPSETCPTCTVPDMRAAHIARGLLQILWQCVKAPACTLLFLTLGLYLHWNRREQAMIAAHNSRGRHFPALFILLGYVFCPGGYPEIASRLLEPQLKRDMPPWLAHRMLVSVHIETNQLEEALELCSTWPRNPGARESGEANDERGNVLRQMPEYEEAKAAFVSAVAIQPDSHKAHYGLGYALYSLGDHAGARREMAEVFRLHPNNKEALKMCRFLDQIDGE